MRIRFYISFVIRYLLVVLFIYAAANKIIDYDQFYNDLRNSPLFGRPAVSLVISLLVPVAELFIAILLLIEPCKRIGLYASASLMLAFTLYVAGVLLFSTAIPCSCGGIISNLSWEAHLVFNVIMTLVACLGVYLIPYKLKPTQNT